MILKVCFFLILVMAPLYVSAQEAQPAGNKGYILGKPPVETPHVSKKKPAVQLHLPNLFRMVEDFDRWLQERLW